MTLNLIRRSVKGDLLTAADHDGNMDKLEAAILANAAELVRGQASKITAGEITIANIGEYVTTGLAATLDSSTANGMTLGSTDQFGLKNTSGSTRLVEVYGSIDAKDGNNLTLGIKFAKNGVAINESECRAFTGAGAQEAKLVTRWMMSLANGDEVSLLIANHTNTSNLELRRGRIVAIEVR